ncbi:DNA-binding response regulator, NarL/FixJ family, contains REC and HTH domains [Leifsonia sp. 98AMF]|uniref:response regulator transcription factor n=1 Tax=unclassified Leifsonia TaxID=2663824 RepID=UPI00087980BE|nr:MULTISPECIES: response regulator transcription factor [unclassified Leifsonia]SDH56736.1 DNA-binding response regulator, NarL/FixJ family, contains REC and HTH domains [Leifsonia sp. 197AMF]SDI82398.1 DNA-binding response regulator, NarL/FixJ family, contains REC and HTH domains [Leifsonia sp. 466MF]SDK02060.1 DNA-binding response regulator, NarL/FixJ family, contains REC and HTH domains [Leifsonia sp. 157MF]SDN85412.1 DNA-binding response regulator, NarL/FixJ family, contains REC and HTH do
MIRVAIADDQPLFCTGLQMMIESQPDLEFAGSAPDGLQAMQLARSARPDVLLMDIRMPVLDGIAATEGIRRENAEPLPRIVVLTTFERDEAVAAALRAGADGFVLKDATPEFILAAIRTVHDGHSVIAPKATTDLFRTLARRRPEAIDALSVREKEVFLLAARGLSNGEIGRTAFISEATVKSHVRSILAKLRLASRVQLVAFAYENGLVR